MQMDLHVTVILFISMNVLLLHQKHIEPVKLAKLYILILEHVLFRGDSDIDD